MDCESSVYTGTGYGAGNPGTVLSRHNPSLPTMNLPAVLLTILSEVGSISRVTGHPPVTSAPDTSARVHCEGKPTR